MDKHKTGRTLRLRLLGAVLSFYLTDLAVRVGAGCGAWYGLYMPAPNLFSLGFSAFFVLLCLAPARHMVGRVLCALLHAVWGVYAVVQYGAYCVLGRFLYLTDFFMADEGTDFLGAIGGLLGVRFVAMVVLLLALNIAGVWLLPVLPAKDRGRVLGMLGACFLGTQLIAPLLYKPAPETVDWDSWQSSGYEYERFTAPVYDMALTGLYQFVAHDAVLSLQPPADTEQARAQVDDFFAARPAHTENEMTGLLAGKNLIMVQLESVDDFVLNAENTPTLARLMEEGICFSEFYTPQYTNGYTFNTEFAAQTGVYPYTNGTAAYTLSRSAFPQTIASLLAEQGYRTGSYHKSEAQFYNRGAMHQAFGFEQYHSALDYAPDELTAGVDRFLVDCDELYDSMTEQTPFCDFLITYSGHLGYDEKDALTSYALAQYPEYADDTRPYEINGLFAKARLTDDLFARLIERLEQDGLLENTVLCVYDDHYAYGLSDASVLQAYSDAAGGRLLERTPCFIWYEGCTPQTVTKTLQTVDLLPTLANLFGLEAPQTMGRDAFDPAYEGCVIFADGAWMTDEAYYAGGEMQWNDGMQPDEIAAMHEYAMKFLAANEAILDTDYYRQEE